MKLHRIEENINDMSLLILLKIYKKIMDIQLLMNIN